MCVCVCYLGALYLALFVCRSRWVCVFVCVCLCWWRCAAARLTDNHFVFLFVAGMKRNSDGETGPAPKRPRPMGDTELRLLVYSKVRPRKRCCPVLFFFFIIIFSRTLVLPTHILYVCDAQVAGSIIGKGGSNISKLRTEVSHTRYSPVHALSLSRSRTYILSFSLSLPLSHPSLFSYPCPPFPPAFNKKSKKGEKRGRA